MKIALLSDIHGNSPALQAVLNDVRMQGCTRLIMLGDVCAGVDPQGCLDLLKAWSQADYIRGNAESYLLTPDLDDLPRQEEPWNSGTIRLIKWLKDRISAADLAWMQSWPESLRWEVVCMLHDSPLDRFFPQNWHDPSLPAKYQEWFLHGVGIHPTTDGQKLADVLAWMDAERVSHLFCGHTHTPFIRQSQGKIICNVGSVGLPLDGDPRAAWVLWEPEIPNKMGLTIRRLEYDVHRTQQMIDDHPSYLADDLPSMRAAHKKMLATGIHWRVHLTDHPTP